MDGGRETGRRSDAGQEPPGRSARWDDGQIGAKVPMTGVRIRKKCLPTVASVPCAQPSASAWSLNSKQLEEENRTVAGPAYLVPIASRHCAWLCWRHDWIVVGNSDRGEEIGRAGGVSGGTNMFLHPGLSDDGRRTGGNG